MSNRRKNNHYHYAEKFENRRRRSSRRAFMPFKSVIISLVVLLMFGLISTTFAVYVTENEPEYDPADETPSIIMQARNLKASRDFALTGASVDLASTGATWSFSGGYLYFEKPSSWTTNASSIQLVIGKGTSGNSSYSSCYTMSSITNTNYYVVSFPSSGWGDATYMCVIGNASDWGSGQWGTSNLTNAAHKTSTYTSGITSSSGQRYIFDGSLTYKGTDDSSMDIVSLKAHACYTTNGSTYTSDNATGGTVKISSYYFSAYNSVATSDTGNGAASASYDAAKTTSAKTSTFTASAATGYRFLGWYTAATGGSSVSTSASYSYSTNGGTKEIYARFIKRYTVTQKNIDANGAQTSSTVDAGTSVTITATPPTGVNFSSWSISGAHSGGTTSSSTTTITPNANVTATASFTLKNPTNLALTYPDATFSDNLTISPTTHSAKSATASGSGSVLHYSYSIAQASGSTVALTEGTDYSIDSSTGEISVNAPGKYTVTMSVYDVAYGLTSGTVTKTATVTVKPNAPSAITYVVSGYTDAESVTDSTGASAADPFKIPIKANAADSGFSIRALIPEGARLSGYIYRWNMGEGTYQSTSPYTETAGMVTKTYGSTSSSVVDTLDEVKTSGTALHVNAAGYYYYSGSVIARYNGVDSAATSFKVYYTVITDFLNVDSYKFSDANNNESIHKIYAADNDLTKINAVYDTGLSSLDTIFLFSNNNYNYTAKEVWTAKTGGFAYNGTNYTATPNDAAHRIATPVDIFDIQSMINYTGVKYFKSYVADARTASNVAAAQPMLHTTVGTSSSGSERTLYFVDKTAQTLDGDTRLMAFFIDASGNTLRYQTAQKLSSRADTYRFYVPTDAVSVTFMYAVKNYYVLPTASNGVISYTQNSDLYKALTDTITLSDYTGMNTFVASTPTANGGGTGIFKYSGYMTTLDNYS